MKKTEKYVVTFKRGIHGPVTVEAEDVRSAVKAAVGEQRRTGGGDGILDMRQPVEIVESVSKAIPAANPDFRTMLNASA